MRAWTIVLFILAVHACLAMFTVANITDIGLNMSLDTTSKTGFTVLPGAPPNVTLPSSDPRFFNSSAVNGSDAKGNGTMLGQGDFIGDFIESILGMGAILSKYMGMFGAAIFSIHTLCAPYFGDFNAWVLEGMVDIVFAISLVQMFTGRSMKTME